MNARHGLIMAASLLILLGLTSQPSRESLFDLDFKGGSAAEFVKAIQQKAKDANIVIMPAAANVPMPAMQLRSIRVQSALSLLDGRTVQMGPEYIELDLRMIPGQESINELHTYSITAETNSQPTRTSIFSVNELFIDDLTSDDLMTAIETTLDLLSESYAAAQVRFHEETGILIVRGHPEQVEAVKDLLRELFESVARGRKRAEQKAAYEKAQQDAQQQAVRAQSAIADFNNTKLAFTEMEARYALMSQQNARTHDELAQSESEKRDLNQMIHALEMKINELQQRLAAKSSSR